MASSSDYKLGDKLGEGAFGSVYKARYSRDCALKAIDISNMLGPEMVAKKKGWIKEVNALIKVRGHDNIVEYRNSFASVDDKLWVEMEFCNGGTLNDYVIDKKPGSTTKHRFMIEISSGVAFLHAQGVVHLDLKPENIMISIDEDDCPHTKVGDFGLARVIASCQQEDKMLHYYQTTGCGTEYFIAPEVYDEHYTEKADIFSMGLIFLSMIPDLHYKKFGGKLYLLVWLPNGFKGIVGYPDGIPYGKVMHENNKQLNTSDGHLNGKVGPKLLKLVDSMIKKKHKDRPSAEGVATILRTISPQELSLLAQPPASPCDSTRIYEY